LLLSATPHQGKTDQFMRLMQLLDRDSFPDEAASAATGAALRHPHREARCDRCRRPAAVQAARHPAAGGGLAGPARRPAALYEAVTDYVRHGYNQALAAKQRHIGFLMILMQRLVTSSTAAIRTTLEKRQACSMSPSRRPSLFENTSGRVGRAGRPVPGGHGGAGQGWEQEKSEVDLLLSWRGKPRPQAPMPRPRRCWS
jgi:hypothetical protein